MENSLNLAMATNNIQFLLNDQMVNLTDIDPNTTVLQYLREHQSSTGTKEGCGSGDCGACTVVTAEIDNTTKSLLNYKSINACITFIGNLHGKQLITIENLKQGAQLASIQQNMVDNHASQCGFCTPGIVMSCYALHQKNQSPSRGDVVQALAGNLCRCTGYRSIIDAAMLSTERPTTDERKKRSETIISRLNEIKATGTLELQVGGKSYFSPDNINALSQYLLANPKSTLVSGGTDLALSVTQNLAEIEQLVYLGNVSELNIISESPQELIIGAAVAYCDFESALRQSYPELGSMIERIGATQVRNTGTLGGNIGNASPIGDMPPVLIALGAKMTLQLGNKTREILVEDYFINYKKTVLAESEFIKNITITHTINNNNNNTLAHASTNQFFKVYKISKRFDDDISAVLVACSIEIDNNIIENVRIAFGGMAAIPKRAKNCEQALQGQAFDQSSIDLAKKALEQDFQPLSDVRASADYRMKVAQNIIQKFFLEISQQKILSRVTDHA